MTLPPTPERVRSGDLLLREALLSDVDDLAMVFADPLIRTWNPGPPDDAGIRDLIAKRNDWESGAHASWVVADASHGRLVGQVSLHEVDLDQGDAQIGYWVAPWARGRGVATESVRAAAAYAFGEMGLHRVHLFHAVENLASCGVATRAGFALEGTLRQSYRYADGRHHDEHLHARLDID